MKAIGLAVYLVALLIFAAICLASPQTIQKIAIKSVERGWASKSMDAYFRSRRYLFLVRSVGFVACLMFTLLFWAFLRRVESGSFQ